MSDLFRRSLGEQVAIETVLAGGLWRVHVDPTSSRSHLNLAVNARDAMPKGGKLTIETANDYLDETYAAAQRRGRAGPICRGRLTDTGARHDARGAGARLRAVLHDEGRRSRHRARASQATASSTVRRQRQNLQRGGPGHDGEDLSSTDALR